MRKTLCWLAVMLVLVFSITAMAAEKGEITVSVEGEVKPGQEITVKTRIKKNPGIYAIQLKPEYDDKVLHLTDVNAEMSGWMLKDKEQGIAKILMFYDMSEQYSDYTGDMLTFTYRVLDDAPVGKSSVSISIVSAGNIDEEFLEFDIVPASIEISCNHVSDNGQITKEATCQNAGEKVFKCTKCGEVIKTETIAKLEHKEDAGTVTKEASCTETGEKVFKCTVGGETLRTETIPALGHKEGAPEVTEEPTCTKAGKRVIKCNVCHEVVKTETIPALGHKEDEGTVTKEPTCMEAGEKTFKCTECHEVTRTEPIEALGHDWEESIEKEPTCKETGVKTLTCKICKESKKETIEKLEHKWEAGEVIKPADCENPGKQNEKCAVCSETRESEIPARGHHWDEGKELKPATCEEAGKKAYTCLNDETHTKEEEIPALGHKWDEGKVVKEAEVGKPGLKIYTCLNDETHTREEEIPALEEEKIKLPDVVGMTIDKALEILETLGLATPISVIPDASMDKDAPLAPDCVVTEMAPAAGEMITKDTEIKLIVKAAEKEDPVNPPAEDPVTPPAEEDPVTPPAVEPKSVILPDVVGKNIEDSSGAIANLGLKWEWPQGVPADIRYVITEMKPAAGEAVPEGTVVQLFYTTEIPKAPAPATEAPVTPSADQNQPAMGDPASIGLWVVMLLSTAGGAICLGRRKH